MNAKSKFYEDAARGGVWLGVAEVLFSAVTMVRPSSLLSLANVAVFVTLLTIFTKRRAARYSAEEGCTYGQCLKFIICMSAFAGVLRGAYSLAASNFFWPEKYHELIDQTVALVAQTGLYADAMLVRVKELYEMMYFSPLWVVLINVLSMVIEGLFFGLFVAGFARREPNPFGERNGGDGEDNGNII